jgi:subtilisin family serine protease
MIATNGIGIASVAPDARLCSVKVFSDIGFGSFADLIAATVYAASIGADVINHSGGDVVFTGEPGIPVLLRALQRAINFATRRGTLFVAAAGNNGLNLNTVRKDLLFIPAELDNVISVGATGPTSQRNFDQLAFYTNFGRSGVDVFAPGGNIDFENFTEEDQILGACSPSSSPDCRAGDAYFFGIGTSFAAPHVAGEAAVIESELRGDQSPARLTACILRSADPLPRPALTAHGRINVLRGARCAAAPASTLVANQ